MIFDDALYLALRHRPFKRAVSVIRSRLSRKYAIDKVIDDFGSIVLLVF
jgi:hypothetical protein